mmetsp:Transcript_9409/g.7190  ORF Transcript_9409/g.7190 Transcript_9409/m.7190 type:complete len:107 (+) Transcript_9409:313-633(+)
MIHMKVYSKDFVHLGKSILASPSLNLAGLEESMTEAYVSRVVVDMWNSVLEESLREFNYMGEMASLKVKFQLLHNNLDVQWMGYDDTLPHFVQETIKNLKHINMAE